MGDFANEISLAPPSSSAGDLLRGATLRPGFFGSKKEVTSPRKSTATLLKEGSFGSFINKELEQVTWMSLVPPSSTELSEGEKSEIRPVALISKGIEESPSFHEERLNLVPSTTREIPSSSVQTLDQPGSATWWEASNDGATGHSPSSSVGSIFSVGSKRMEWRITTPFVSPKRNESSPAIAYFGRDSFDITNKAHNYAVGFASGPLAPITRFDSMEKELESVEEAASDSDIDFGNMMKRGQGSPALKFRGQSSAAQDAGMPEDSRESPQSNWSEVVPLSENSEKFDIEPGECKSHCSDTPSATPGDTPVGTPGTTPLVSPYLRVESTIPTVPEDSEVPSFNLVEGSQQETPRSKENGKPLSIITDRYDESAETRQPAQVDWEERRERRETHTSEVEIMKERFSKLLLGEDMSGGSKGVCQALAISNAITNLSASVFGERWKLAPLSKQRKHLWSREMEWLLCVSDYIVELVPGVQMSSDGVQREVMLTKQRGDLLANLPALRKVDGMLFATLDSFEDVEFWYAENREGSDRNQDKWWLPTPRVPAKGLSEEGTSKLHQAHEVAQQILKASMAINGQVLSEMDIPDAYVDSLPKTGRIALGEVLYRYITQEFFSADKLLSKTDLTTEMAAVEFANKLETAIHVWRRKVLNRNTPLRDLKTRNMTDRVRDLIGDTVKMEGYAQRAEATLLLLRARCPGLPQTTLDSCKIQYNRDVGRAILESYSRVMESLASNIVSRIEDVLYANALVRDPAACQSDFFQHRFLLDIPTLTSDILLQDLEPHEAHRPLHPTSSRSASMDGGFDGYITPTSPLSLRSEGSSSFQVVRSFFKRRPPGLPKPGIGGPNESLMKRLSAEPFVRGFHGLQGGLMDSEGEDGTSHYNSGYYNSPDMSGSDALYGSFSRSISADNRTVSDSTQLSPGSRRSSTTITYRTISKMVLAPSKPMQSPARSPIASKGGNHSPFHSSTQRNHTVADYVSTPPHVTSQHSKKKMTRTASTNSAADNISQADVPRERASARLGVMSGPVTMEEFHRLVPS